MTCEEQMETSEPAFLHQELTAASVTEGCVLQEAVRSILRTITEACEGLMDFLQQLRDADGSQDRSLRTKLSAAVQDMESVDWLVPPMLQKR